MTLIAKSLSLLGRWHISKKTPNYMHVLFKGSGNFGFQILKWGQKARARTSWTELFIFIAIPMAKRKHFLRYLLLSKVVKRTQNLMIKSWQAKSFNHLGISSLNNLPFCFFPLTALAWINVIPINLIQKKVKRFYV